jgi:hypothetical protein
MPTVVAPVSEEAIRKPDATCCKMGQRSVAPMEHDEVSGPVQLTMHTFRGPQLPADMRRLVDGLRNQSDQVRLVDSLILQKNSNGTLTQQPLPDAEPEVHSAGLISKILNRAEAEATLATGPASTYTYESRTGRGILFRGERMPDPRDAVPPGMYALALMVEHRWAAPIHDAIMHSDTSPLGNAWIGIDALEEVGLISSETANKLATA